MTTAVGERPADPGYEALAADGRVVRVRPATRGDVPALHGLGERSSDRSLYLRFFSANRSVADGYLTSLAGADDDRARVTRVIEVDGRLVAVAGWERVAPDTAEVALLVEDDQQGRGLGTLLVEELAESARAAGVTTFVADSLVENRRMFEVFSRSGLRSRQEQDAGVLHWELATDLDEPGMAAVDGREASAEAASLAPLLSPRSVVVVGAGAGAPRGEAVLHRLTDSGFAGTVRVVDPDELEVAGYPCAAHVADLPERPDLAVIALPPDRALEALRECGRAGVRAAVVMSAVDDPAGEVRATARQFGVRLVGPDSLGVVNTDPAVRLAAWAGGSLPRAGRVAVATQSGAVGIAIAEHARRDGLGLAALVSLGAKADISGNDLLLAWWQDPRVAIVALYLESLGNPRKLARLARRVGTSKPVVVVKGGRADEPAVEALCHQAGVLRTSTVAELLDVARVLDAQPLPAGGRLAVVGNGGGIGVLAADAAAAAGLDVPPLPEGVRRRLGPGADNPVDLGADLSPARLRGALEVVAGSRAADTLLVALAVTDDADTTALLAAVSEAYLGDLAVVVTLVGAAEPPRQVLLARGDAAPVFAFPEPAVRAVGLAVRHGRWRRTGGGTVCRPGGLRSRDARALMDDALADALAPPAARQRLAERLLGCYGVVAGALPQPDPAGVDLVVGVEAEAAYGPLVSVRVAGPLPELLGDRTARLAPLTDRDVGAMLAGLRAWPLLQGHGGGPARDVAAVEDLLHRVSALADDLPEIGALRLEPVRVGAHGLAVAVAHLALSSPTRSPHPRRRALR